MVLISGVSGEPGVIVSLDCSTWSIMGQPSIKMQQQYMQQQYMQQKKNQKKWKNKKLNAEWTSTAWGKKTPSKREPAWKLLCKKREVILLKIRNRKKKCQKKEQREKRSIGKKGGRMYCATLLRSIERKNIKINSLIGPWNIP